MRANELETIGASRDPLCDLILTLLSCLQAGVLAGMVAYMCVHVVGH